MKVVATRRGYYGDLREPGEQFTISGKEALSERWMEPVEEEKPRKAKPSKSDD